MLSREQVRICNELREPPNVTFAFMTSHWRLGVVSTSLVILTALFSGCSTYVPPGAKADLAKFAPASIAAEFEKKATNPFPAGVAVARLQASGYSNYRIGRVGRPDKPGSYSVILSREVEDASDIDRVGKLPSIAGIVGLNRMLIGEQIAEERELRFAASKVQADLLFVYTFETAFFDRNLAKPLSVITLGLSPTRKIRAVTTVSALLMDTRTGYIYSAYERTVENDTLATSWGSSDAADAVRVSNEKKAFKELIDEVVSSWSMVLKRHGQTG